MIGETKNGVITNSTLDLVNIAAQKADSLGGQISLVLLGNGISNRIDEPISSGVDRLLIADHPSLEHYDSDIYTEIVGRVINKEKFALVLLNHSFTGADLGASLSGRFGIPLISNCLDFALPDRTRVIATRLLYKGKLGSRISIVGFSVLLLSLAEEAATVHNQSQRRKAEVITIPVKHVSSRIRFLEVLKDKSDEKDISNSEIIVAVGLGVESEKGLLIVQELAEELGASLGCSRPIVERGWLLKAHQVGMSGKIVNPKLYVACGISGAIEHLVGMRNSGTIISINKDPSAPIFKYSDYGFVGDLFQIVPAIVREIRRKRSRVHPASL